MLVSAFVFRSNASDSHEQLYDHVLVLAFVVTVPVAFVLTIWSKLQLLMQILEDGGEDMTPLQRAYQLQKLGLALEEDRQVLQDFAAGLQGGGSSSGGGGGGYEEENPLAAMRQVPQTRTMF